MERTRFVKLSSAALNFLDGALGDLEHADLDVDLGGDVLTLEFADGTSFIINAHSAAGQIWMAANSSAWHFDYLEDRGRWVASKTGDELLATVQDAVSKKLGTTVVLKP